MAGLTPMEIVRRTPKNNCGQCGFPACLAFAAAAATGTASLDRCPFLDRSGLTAAPAMETSEDRDWELVRTLKAKVADLEPAAVAPALGLDYGTDGVLRGRCLGRDITLEGGELTIDGDTPADPRDAILIYNYLAMAGNAPLTGQWIGMESMPNSISKVKSLARYAEEPLAEVLDRATAGSRRRATLALDGRETVADTCDWRAEFLVLPRLPLAVSFWASDAEDGFAAKVKILYDASATTFLDIESLVFAAERLAERFRELCQ